MPSLIRFLVFCGVLGGIVLGSMIALDVFVEPTPRPMSERISSERLPD
ncbi:MAG: hypothetical protein AAF638_01600 [Pseudomonadota bacterium]